MQRRLQIFYGHIFVEGAAQICVCIIFMSQELAAPVWTQQGEWLTYSNFFQTRTLRALANFVVRVCFHLVMALILGYRASYMLPMDFGKEMRIFTWPMLTFIVGIALS